MIEVIAQLTEDLARNLLTKILLNERFAFSEQIHKVFISFKVTLLCITLEPVSQVAINLGIALEEVVRHSLADRLLVQSCRNLDKG